MNRALFSFLLMCVPFVAPVIYASEVVSCVLQKLDKALTSKDAELLAKKGNYSEAKAVLSEIGWQDYQIAA